MSALFLFFAIGALLLLGTVFVSKDVSSRRIAVPVLLGAFVMMLVINRASSLAGYYPNSRAVRLVKGLELQLHKTLADRDIRRIILVEGSSYSARGLDGAMMSRLVTRGTGIPTEVLQLTLDGANHFERSWILQNAIDRLSPEEKRLLQAVDVTLLMEIQRGYDYAPLNGFMRNLGTFRTYAYMTIPNSVAGLHAVESVGSLAPEPALVVFPHVTSHMLVNAMSVGMAYRGVAFDEVEPLAGYQPLRKAKRRYRYDGSMRDIVERARLKRQGDDQPSPTTPDWVDSIRVPRYQRILDGLVDRTGWYAVPSTETADFDYVESFCDRRLDSICIRYSDPRLLKRLNRKPDWNDDRHMRISGAEKYTRWLAQRYVRDLSRSINR
jgi:hypothetical protein